MFDRKMRRTSYGRRHCNRDFMPVSQNEIENLFSRLASLSRLTLYSDCFANLSAMTFLLWGLNSVAMIYLQFRWTRKKQRCEQLHETRQREREREQERKSPRPTDSAHAYRRGARKSVRPISAPARRHGSVQ